MEQSKQEFTSLMSEDRRFPPPPAFAARAGAATALIQRATADREAFWAEQARELHWFVPFGQVLEWQPPHARWFLGGRLNAAYNCVDRHVLAGKGERRAIVWEGEAGEQRTLTYADLLAEVGRLAGVLVGLGVGAGDRVAVFLPNIPEAIVSMLACARIGAIHSVVFSGFAADALRDRINDCQAKVLITGDGAWRRGKAHPLKQIADAALALCPSVERVLVVRRCGHSELVAGWQQGRDIWYHEAMAAATACPPAELEAEHPLFILYTSGSTGKPKGCLHVTGGFLTQAAATTRHVFDLGADDVHWCTADVGWITAHSYQIYGPLALGATILLFEGTPDYPHRGRWWEVIERHRVTTLYTAPTAIRAAMKWGEGEAARYNLSSLRLLGSVGEPINPEAWIWYHRVIGGGRCPIVDTWWQSETGAILIAPLPTATDLKPGSATRPFPGIDAEVVDEAGQPVAPGGTGYLVVRSPWPAMLRTVWGDDQRYVDTYFSRFGNRTYFSGDGARKDADGYFWLLGRVDDVVNVSGHRIGTMEVESILVEHPAVAEAAVIGRDHPLKGQAISAFVMLKEGAAPTEELAVALKAHVAARIGAIARPEEITFAPELPKNRSGKLMRRLLRDIAEGRPVGDTTTLVDPTVVAVLQAARRGG